MVQGTNDGRLVNPENNETKLTPPLLKLNKHHTITTPSHPFKIKSKHFKFGDNPIITGLSRLSASAHAQKKRFLGGFLKMTSFFIY